VGDVELGSIFGDTKSAVLLVFSMEMAVDEVVSGRGTSPFAAAKFSIRFLRC